MPLQHFKTQELVDIKTYEKVGEDALLVFNPIILITLDNVWEFFNLPEMLSAGVKRCPIVVNDWLWRANNYMQWRGYRTPEKAKVLGSPNSEHVGSPTHLADAFDCNIGNYTGEQARKIILDNQDHPLLANITRLEGNVSWVHIDCKQLNSAQRRIYVFKA